MQPFPMHLWEVVNETTLNKGMQAVRALWVASDGPDLGTGVHYKFLGGRLISQRLRHSLSLVVATTAI